MFSDYFQLDDDQTQKVREIAKRISWKPLQVKYREEKFGFGKHSIVPVFPAGAGPFILKTSDDEFYDVLDAVLAATNIFPFKSKKSKASLGILGLIGASMIAIRERKHE